MSKYSHIDFRPPASVAKEAKKGLELREKAGGKGGLSVSEAKSEGVGSGVQRAVNLKNRDKLSPETVKRMKAFFDRHKKNKSIGKGKKPWEDRGHVAWCLTGDTNILLEDGSSKTIKEICENKLSVRVLSYNENSGNIEAQAVSNWFINNSNIGEFRVVSKGKSRRQGLTNKTNLKITGEHPIWNGSDWVPVSKSYSIFTIHRKKIRGSLLSLIIKSITPYSEPNNPPICLHDEYFLSEESLLSNKKAEEYYKASSALKPYKWSKKYNLTVEGNNNFFANGVLVHNCLWGAMQVMRGPRKLWVRWRRQIRNPRRVAIYLRESYLRRTYLEVQ